MHHTHILQIITFTKPSLNGQEGSVAWDLSHSINIVFFIFISYIRGRPSTISSNSSSTSLYAE